MRQVGAVLVASCFAWGVLTVGAVAQAPAGQPAMIAELTDPSSPITDPAASEGSMAVAGPEPSIFRDDLLQAIYGEASARQDSSSDDERSRVMADIADYYGRVDAKPIWVGPSGWTIKANEFMSELARADQYALNPADYKIGIQVNERTPAGALAVAEIDMSILAAKYASHARGGRVDPSQLSLWLDVKPQPINASEVLRTLAETSDMSQAVRALHPRHPQFERLRLAYLAERGDIEPPALPMIQPGDTIASGARHPDIVLIRERLGIPAASDANADLLDRTLMKRIRAIASQSGLGRKNSIDDSVREAINRQTPPRPGSRKSLLDRYLVNLERWRSIPDDMGSFYVWNNLPEFTTRVVKGGEVIHEERIIIGKESTQTPVFSDTMTHVYFQPEWGVPESIKIKSLLPYLRGGDTGVLSRRNMRIKDGDRVISPSRYNWSKVDIRSVPIVQGPGSGNPLGRLKFMFPNDHAVYMHDTPDKHLFNSQRRTFSAGCIRVRNPARFAEVILGEVDGWAPGEIDRQLKNKSTHRVDFSAGVPVHNTYFTVWVNPDGRVVQFTDVYSHDKRMQEALEGKSIKTIAARDPALAHKRRNDELRRNIAGIAPKPKVRQNSALPGFAAAQPFPPFGKPPQPFKPYGLGKSPKKKYSSPAPPPRLLWFQQY